MGPVNGRAITRPTRFGPVEQLARDFAHAVELGDGNHVLVRGDLKNAVARRV